MGAFAGAEAASDRMCITSNAAFLMPLSAQDVCFCASSDGCNGGQIDTPWDYIQSYGAVTGGQYQGSGPFGSGFCSDFANYDGGMYHHVSGSSVGGHAVKIVGWGEEN